MHAACLQNVLGKCIMYEIKSSKEKKTNTKGNIIYAGTIKQKKKKLQGLLLKFPITARPE